MREPDYLRVLLVVVVTTVQLKEVVSHDATADIEAEYDLPMVVEIRKPPQIHQSHVLNQFNSLESRLDFIRESFEQDVAYWPSAIHRNLSYDLVTPQDIHSILDMQYYTGVLKGDEHARILKGYRIDFSEIVGKTITTDAPFDAQSSNTIRGRLIDALKDSSSLILHGIHTHHRPVSAVTEALSACLATSVDANVYVSPPGGTNALELHTDETDVFILQVSGRKTWHIHPPPVRLLRSSPPNPSPKISNDYRDLIYETMVRNDDIADGMFGTSSSRMPHSLGNASLLPVKITLSPGDVLYLPRGTPHEAVNAADETPDGIQQVDGELGAIQPQLQDDQGRETSTHLTMSFLSGSLSYKNAFVEALYFFVDHELLEFSEAENIGKILDEMHDNKDEHEHAKIIPVTNRYHIRHYSTSVYPVTGVAPLLRSTLMYPLFCPRTFSPVLFPCLFASKDSNDSSSKGQNLSCSTTPVGVETSFEDVQFASEKQNIIDILKKARNVEKAVEELQRAYIRKFVTLVHAIAYHIELKHGSDLALRFRQSFNVETKLQVYDSKNGMRARALDETPDLREKKSSQCTGEDEFPKLTIYEMSLRLAKVYLSTTYPPLDDDSTPTKSPDFPSLFYEDGSIGKFPRSSNYSDRNPLRSPIMFPQQLQYWSQAKFRRRSDLPGLVIPSNREVGFQCGALPYYVPQLAASRESLEDIAQRSRIQALSRFTSYRQCANPSGIKRYLLYVPRMQPLELTLIEGGLAEQALQYPPGIRFSALDICRNFLKDLRFQRDYANESDDFVYTDEMQQMDDSKCREPKLARKTHKVLIALLQTGTVGIDSGNWPDQDF